MATHVVLNEGTLLKMDGTVTNFGDIHGQYKDLMQAFNYMGLNNEGNNPYNMPKIVFSGDYVDRGNKSIECLVAVILLKLKYPDRIGMLKRKP